LFAVFFKPNLIDILMTVFVPNKHSLEKKSKDRTICFRQRDLKNNAERPFVKEQLFEGIFFSDLLDDNLSIWTLLKNDKRSKMLSVS
jgi:hypothetical protein